MPSCSNFDPTLFECSEPKQLTDAAGKPRLGSMTGFFNYPGCGYYDVSFQVPKARTPFGTKSFEEGADANKRKKSLKYELIDPVFLKWLRKFDETFLKAAMENREKWWPTKMKNGKSTMTDKAIAERFFPSVKYSKNPDDSINDEYPPAMKLSAFLPGEKRACKVSIITRENTRYVQTAGTLDDVSPNSQIIMRVAPVSYWVSPSLGFGVQWSAVEIGVFREAASAEQVGLVLDLPVVEAPSAGGLKRKAEDDPKAGDDLELEDDPTGEICVEETLVY